MQNNARIWLELDLNKLANNFKAICKHVYPCSVMPILKANAYGLGVASVADTLANAGAEIFGVAELNEAIELIQTGKRVKILGSLLPFETEKAVEYNVICSVDNLETAQRLNAEGINQGKNVDVSLAIDTGMGRLGMISDNALEEILEISKLSNINIISIYSHFSSAFMKYDTYSDEQLLKFKELYEKLLANGLSFKYVHMAASDAINNFGEAMLKPFNLVRSGINLYGFCDSDVKTVMDLQGVISLKTQLVAVRELPQGSAIGYGRMHRMKKKSLVGTIAAGYADGLPLALSNRGYVIIRGTLCPVIGRISMDYTTVLLDGVDDAKVGDEVICIGSDGDCEVTLDEWAKLKGTHAYELLCSFGNRVKRMYF